MVSFHHSDKATNLRENSMGIFPWSTTSRSWGVLYRAAVADGERIIVAIKRDAQFADPLVDNITSSLHPCIAADKVDRNIATKHNGDVKPSTSSCAVWGAEFKTHRYLSSGDAVGVIRDNPRHHDGKVLSTSRGVNTR